MSLEAAREAIDNKFKINVTEEYSDTYAKGLVMQQDPESDTELEEGKTIKLVVSKGQKIEDKVTVPDVRSKTKSGAQSELKAAGLKVSIKESYSDDVAKGEVISQTPSHGSKVSKNTTVVITVSKGKKEDQTVSVPNLRYYTESEASQELQRFGLSLGSVLTEYSDSVEKGMVISQTVTPGGKAAAGTTISITVSNGPKPEEKIDIQSFVGQQESALKSWASQNGLYTNVSDSQYSSSYAKRMYHLHESFFWKYFQGSTISYVVSLGAKPQEPTNGGTTGDNNNQNGSNTNDGTTTGQ